MLTILEGSTFCICDDRGDIAADTSGLFAHDTRFLSRLVLRVGGSTPLLLSSGRVEHFRAAFYLRNGTATGLPRDAISVARERFIGTGMQERITLRNESPEPLEVDVSLEAEADFADIISVKLHDFSLGDPELAQPLPAPAPTSYDEASRHVSIVDPRGDLGTRLMFSKAGAFEGNAMTYALTLEPHERWDLSVDVHPYLDEELETFEQLDEERETASDGVAAWTLRVPRVRGGWDSLRRSFDRSIDDLAALRMRTGESRRPLFAAGMPWFMTVFGTRHRDHVAADAPARPGDRGRRARRAHRAAGAGGRPVHRRRARQDRPRGARGPVRRVLVPALLRLDRLHTSLSGAARRDLALDGRRVVRAAHARAGHARARVDRPLRRPRRRRLRRVQPDGRLRAREPVVEGLGRLAALPGRLVRRGADRGGRGAGLRLRRKARARRDRARGLARARSSRIGSSARPTSCGRASTRRSGSRSGAASTRSRSTGRSGASIRVRRTWATCSGAASFRRNA